MERTGSSTEVVSELETVDLVGLFALSRKAAYEASSAMLSMERLCVFDDRHSSVSTARPIGQIFGSHLTGRPTTYMKIQTSIDPALPVKMTKATINSSHGLHTTIDSIY